ncbi:MULTISPECIES: hypothetical protein [unclassified Burkholderia]|uniref:hypothetical protein n=1 Tax=unclassified Burkholderia TaxID=2613784 RepID=UPI000F5818C2|nr:MULTISPECIES: hypothetical protein [unclassified Burkholderia]RQR87671.1 hypothetical protein DIE10_06160 [Burkholderia sp. Bp9011]
MIDIEKMKALAETLRTYTGAGCVVDDTNAAATAIDSLLSELEAREADRRDAERPSVVLTYSTKGHSRPCGQTMGANGCGEFAILYYGNIETADKAARAHLNDMQRASYRFDWTSIIRSDDETYYGTAMTTVSLAQRQGEEK